MKRLCFILLSIIISVGLAFSQDNPIRFTKRKIRQGSKNAICVHRNKYSATERLNFYPFKNAATIKLVSFEQPDDAIIRLPMQNGKVDYSILKETIELTNEQIVTLTDILFNSAFKGGNFIFGPAEGECYVPRNAILFLDPTHNTYAFIELCFECHRFRASSEDVQTGDFCDGKYSLLKEYFIKCGIKIGVTGAK